MYDFPKLFLKFRFEFVFGTGFQRKRPKQTIDQVGDGVLFVNFEFGDFVFNTQIETEKTGCFIEHLILK